MVLPHRPRAVITGAAKGLGRALSLELASRREARLLLSDIDEAPLDETADLARAAGAEVAIARADVGRLEDVVALEAAARACFGGTDLLVNNAGVAVVGRVGEVSIADWRWQLEVNLWGVIYGCHVFVPGMLAQRRGAILNVASAAGLVSVPELGPYNVTKASVVALTRTLRGEVRRHGVTVSVLCPTFFQSHIHRTARMTDAQLRPATTAIIEGAPWSAEDIARAALRGLERGRLHIVPQLDARLLWWLHRLSPGGFQGLVERVHRSRIVERWALNRARRRDRRA